MNKVKNPKLKLYIEITAPKARRLRGLRPRLEKTAQVVMKRLAGERNPLTLNAEATLLVASNGIVRRLNREFRKRDKPTNVLSFPHLTRKELDKKFKGIEPAYLGDIAIAFDYTADEARRENKKLEHHMTHLLIHGLLHLFGYDHRTTCDATRMERLERKLMAELGLPNPYAPAERGKRTRRKA